MQGKKAAFPVRLHQTVTAPVFSLCNDGEDVRIPLASTIQLLCVHPRSPLCQQTRRAAAALHRLIHIVGTAADAQLLSVDVDILHAAGQRIQTQYDIQRHRSQHQRLHTVK